MKILSKITVFFFVSILILTICSCGNDKKSGTASSLSSNSADTVVSGNQLPCKIDSELIFGFVERNKPLTNEKTEQLKIKDFRRGWHNDFTFFIVDTLNIAPYIFSVLIAEYYSEECYAYLANFSSGGRRTGVIDVFYDNAEGCRGTTSEIGKDKMIRVKEYDCYKEEDSAAQAPVQSFSIGRRGTFIDVSEE